MGCSLHGRHWIVSVCSSSLGEIGSLCNGWYNGINWLANGWMGWKDHMERGWDGVGMEGPTLAGADGAPPLSLEVRWATESGRRRREAVSDTNCIGAARSRSICFRAV